MTAPWQRVRLNDAYWFQEGPGVRKWQFTDSGVKLLNVANIVKDGSIDLTKTDRHISSDEAYAKYKHFLADEGDLAIASSGISFDTDGYLRTRGGFIEKEHLPLCMNTSTIRFKAIKGRSDLRFLKHWLQSLEFRTQITRRVTGSAQQNFGPSHLKEIDISLPPLEEQRRIAEVLDLADALRQKRRLALKKLDALLHSVFIDMFGDPVRNPKGWNRAVLGDLIHSAKDGPHVSPEYVDDGIPFLSTRNIRQGRIDWDDLKYISQKDAEYHWRKAKPERGDILYTKGGTTGIAKMVDFDDDIAVWVHVALLKTNRELVEPIWLENMLNSNFCYVQSQRYTHGIANRDLGLKRMIKIKMYLPPISEQRRFVEFTLHLQSLRNRLEKALNNLNALFTSVQHRALKGELFKATFPSVESVSYKIRMG